MGKQLKTRLKRLRRKRWIDRKKDEIKKQIAESKKEK